MHPRLERRAALHAALGEPTRLAIVEELARSDRSPGELIERLGITSNLLAHHLDVLEEVGLITRLRSSGDRRRRYVHLDASTMRTLWAGRAPSSGAALFVCSRNSARSPLAAALWRQHTGAVAMSAGTHPAKQVHPGAVAAAGRLGLDLGDTGPQHLHDIDAVPALVVTVCDQAHEELGDDLAHLHWSIPDPVRTGTARAFDRVCTQLAARIAQLATAGEDR